MPEAIINHVSLLGWRPYFDDDGDYKYISEDHEEDEKEVYKMGELIRLVR